MTRRAAHFARAVATRYAHRSSRWARRRLVFLVRRLVPPSVRIVRHGSSVAFAPRLALTFVAHGDAPRAQARPRVRTVAPPGRVLAPRERVSGPAVSLLTERVTRTSAPAGRPLRERLLERILAHGRRLDGWPAQTSTASVPELRTTRLALAGAGSGPPQVLAPTTPPVARVVRITHQERDAVAGSPHQHAPVQAAPPIVSAAPPSDASPTDEPDLGRLTDSVLSVLDRRLVAHRERLGRP
jgi:hypothetical protein